MSNPLTGTFGPQPGGIPLDPVAIFDPSVGIREILVGPIENPVVVGLEIIEVSETRHLWGTVDAESLAALTLVDLSGNLSIDLWMDVVTNHGIRVEITEESGDRTFLEFFTFDEPATIPSP